MKTIVVTGANRGIELGLVKCFLEKNYRVIATARDPERASELQALAAQHPETCIVETLDIGSDLSVHGFGAKVEEHGGVDILVNNAGVIGESGAPFSELSFDAVKQTFDINAVGPMRVTRALLPSLKKGPQPVVASITSKMGSIADNTGGGAYSYRMSKAALNMFNMSFARDFKDITAVVLHPGWVKTDMGGSQAPTSVDESAHGLARVITELSITDSGRFLDFQGNDIPW